MKRYLALVLLAALPVSTQITDEAKYSPRAILLIDAAPGVESVMPLVFTENGQSHIEYVPASKIKVSIDKGGKPIRLGDVLSLLGQENEKISRLQAENDKLWQVVTKAAPSAPQTVIVQQSAPAPLQPSAVDTATRAQADADARRAQAVEMWMRLQSQSQPHSQTTNVYYRDCTRFPALCVNH